MPLVLIAHAPEDRPTVAPLARELAARGYDTWMEDSVRDDSSGHREAAGWLDRADAIVVVWTTASAGSDWVYSIAARAARMDKLVSCRVDGFDPLEIPPPFDARNTVTDRELDRIIATLEARGVRSPVDVVEAAAHPDVDPGARPSPALLETLRRQRSRLSEPAAPQAADAPPRVFISYAREDRPMAEDLADFLLAAGYEPWWDRALHAGERFAAEIDEQIDAAGCVVVLWSPASIASPWVRAEAERAARGRKLLPLAVHGVAIETIPEPFSRFHTIPADSTRRLLSGLSAYGLEPGLATEVRYRSDDVATSVWNTYVFAKANRHYQASCRLDLEGRQDMAIAEIDQTIEVLPREAQWWQVRALYNFKRQRYDEALGDIDRALAIQADDEGFLSFRALTNRRSGRLADALRDARRALSIDPHSSGANGVLKEIDLETGQLTASRCHHAGMVTRHEATQVDLADVVADGYTTAVARIPGDLAVTAFADGTIRMIDLATMAERWRRAGHEGPVSAVIAVDDRCFLSCGHDGRLLIWDRDAQAPASSLACHHDKIWGIALCGGARVVTASADRELRVWSLDTGRQTGRLTGHEDVVMAVCAIDGDRVVSASRDGTLRVWSLSAQREQQRGEVPGGWGYGLCATPDGRVVSSNGRGEIQVWQEDLARPATVFDGHAGDGRLVVGIAALDETTMASAGSDGTVRIWESGTGQEIGRLTNAGTPEEPRIPFTALDRSPFAGSLLASDAIGRVHLLMIERPPG